MAEDKGGWRGRGYIDVGGGYKKAAFSELARILKPGGTLAVADLMVTEKIPPEVLAGKDAWST